jgi:hypothetical protein
MVLTQVMDAADLRIRDAVRQGRGGGGRACLPRPGTALKTYASTWTDVHDAGS